MRNRLVVILGLAAGCADSGLSSKIDALEQRVQKLEAGQSGAPGGPGARPPGATGDPAEEKAAGDLLRQANQAADAMHYDEARAHLAELQEKYPDSRLAKAGARLAQDLDVIGKPAKALDVDQVFKGSVPDVTTTPVSLTMLWDASNPQSKQILTRLQAVSAANAGKLSVVALARATPDVATQVPPLLQESGVTFAVASEKGKATSDYYGASGAPAAIVIKGGKVVWRGHPTRLTDELLAQILAR